MEPGLSGNSTEQYKNFLILNPENIPEELKKIQHWICWKPELNKEGKLIKKPVAPWKEGELVPVNPLDPQNWTNFEQAVDYAKKFNIGIGFVLTSDLNLVGIDLDKCIEEGEINNWVKRIIQEANSYVEITPSKKGVRIWLKGSIPENLVDHKLKVEIYKEKRFLTVTGNWINFSPKEIRENQEFLDKFYLEIKKGGKEEKKKEEKVEDEIKEIIKEVEEKEKEEKEKEEKGKEKEEKRLRELTDSEIIKIVELLKEAYKPGQRQFLLLYLSGWLAKAKISPISALKIAKILYEEKKDEDPIKIRLSAIVYSYKKAGIDVNKFSEIEEIAGIKPYGLEKEIKEEEIKIKGKSGIQEILESVFGEEKALDIIHELSEILGVLSPYRSDSIVELVDYGRRVYAIANLKKLIMVRAKKEIIDMRDKKIEMLTYMERVAVVAPTKVIVYESPIGGVRKYEIVFEGQTLRKPLTIGPALLEEIADRLKAEGLVYHSRLIYDILSAIVQAFIRKGKAEIKVEIESMGFYLVDDKVVAVRYSIEFNREKLREALKLLDELANNWFSHNKEKFATIIKWGVIAPFSYILKAKGKWKKWIYLYGDSATGKTTLGKVVLRIWGLDSKNEKTGASIDTIARFGYVLSQSTFPVLVNEPGNALSREEIVEAIKNAIDSSLVRGKYYRGTYIEIPALAPLIFTSNKFYPHDDALRRRLLVITFSYGEKIAEEKQKLFKKEVETRWNILSEIGKCIANIVVNEPNILEMEDVGKNLLEKCYEIAGLQKPEWLEMNYKEEEDFASDVIGNFVFRLKKHLNDLYAKYVSRLVMVDESALEEKTLTQDQVDFQEKVKILLFKNLVPGVKLKEGKVIIKKQLLDEIGIEISLKSLAELLNAEYNNKYSEKIGGKVFTTSVMILDIQKLLEILS